MTSQPVLDRTVLGLVQQYLTREETLGKLRESLHRAVAEQPDTSRQRKQLQAKIRKLEQQLRQGVQNLLLVKPEYIPAMQQQMDAWQTEKGQLEQQVQELGGRADLPRTNWWNERSASSSS